MPDQTPKISGNVNHRGPDSFSDLKISEPLRIAAGTQGIYHGLKHNFKEMKVTRSLSVLLKMYQKNGFDCPSCAWPDPEHPSPVAEYCENGAKALADEATRSHIGKEFFKKYSVEELSRFSDYQINAFGRRTEPLVLKEGSLNYVPITWEAAYELIADHLRNLKDPKTGTRGSTMSGGFFL